MDYIFKFSDEYYETLNQNNDPIRGRILLVKPTESDDPWDAALITGDEENVGVFDDMIIDSILYSIKQLTDLEPTEQQWTYGDIFYDMIQQSMLMDHSGSYPSGNITAYGFHTTLNEYDDSLYVDGYWYNNNVTKIKCKTYLFKTSDEYVQAESALHSGELFEGKILTLVDANSGIKYELGMQYTSSQNKVYVVDDGAAEFISNSLDSEVGGLRFMQLIEYVANTGYNIGSYTKGNEENLFTIQELYGLVIIRNYSDNAENKPKKALRTLSKGQSDITRHESLNKKESLPVYQKYYLTIKQVTELFCNYLRSITTKHNTYKQEHLDDPDYEEDIFEKNLSAYHFVINALYGIRIRTDNTATTGVINFHSKDGTCIDIYTQLHIIGPTIKVEFGNDEFIEFNTNIYTLQEEYNGNDVFSIYSVEAINGDYSEETVFDTVQQWLLDEVVLLSPKGTLENFVIAYSDGNGGYTTEKPQGSNMNPIITNNEAYPDDNYFIGFDTELVPNNIRDAVIEELTSGDNWKKFATGTMDFSPLSALDDIKIEVSRDVYNIITNPWNYIDENIVLSGKEVINIVYSGDEKNLLVDLDSMNGNQINVYDCGICDGELLNLVKDGNSIKVKQIFTQDDLHDGQYSKEINGITYISNPIETPRNEFQDFDSFVSSEYEITLFYRQFTKTANSNTFTNDDVIINWVNLQDILKNMRANNII